MNQQTKYYFTSLAPWYSSWTEIERSNMNWNSTKYRNIRWPTRRYSWMQRSSILSRDEFLSSSLLTFEATIGRKWPKTSLLYCTVLFWQTDSSISEGSSYLLHILPYPNLSLGMIHLTRSDWTLGDPQTPYRLGLGVENALGETKLTSLTNLAIVDC